MNAIVRTGAAVEAGRHRGRPSISVRGLACLSTLPISLILLGLVLPVEVAATYYLVVILPMLALLQLGAAALIWRVRVDGCHPAKLSRSALSRSA